MVHEGTELLIKRYGWADAAGGIAKIMGKSGAPGLSLTPCSPASAKEEHRKGEDGQEDGDPLGVAEQVAEEAFHEQAAGHVAAEGLDDRASGGVQAQVQQHDLAVEGFFPVEGVDRDGGDEQPTGLVELHRMQRGVLRSDGHGVGEDDREGAIGVASIAASGAETTDTRGDMAYGKSSTEHVPHLVERDLVPIDHKGAGGKACDHGPVEDQASGTQVEPLGPGLEVLGILDDIERPGARQCGERCPEQQVSDVLSRDPLFLTPINGEKGDNQEAEGPHEAVGMNLEVAK